MSLPATKKSAPEHAPVRNVSDSENKRGVGDEINQNLEFPGVVEAFHHGRLPDNSTIENILSFVRDLSPVDIDKLSHDGKKLIQDVRDILETARLLVVEKNVGELFQNFFWHTRNARFHGAKQHPSASLPVSSEQTQADGQQALQHLRTLLSLVLTNADVRKLLRDFSTIGRDILALSATHITDTDIRPDQDPVEREQERNVLTEEYFPAERRDQFIYRLKKVIVECQKHSDYESSMTWLLGLLENYAQHGPHGAGAEKDGQASLTSYYSLQQAMTELRTILERIANNTSLEAIFKAMDAIYADAERDEELRRWFRSVDAYICKILFEPGFVLNDESNHDANRLRDSGKRFIDDKYKLHFDNLFDSVGAWVRSMGEDPLNVRFGDAWGRLTRDLLFDDKGNLTFKPHLWDDIARLFALQIVDQPGYTPIPRIEYTDDDLDLVIENLTLSGCNTFSKVIMVEQRDIFKISPFQNFAREHHEEFHVSFAQAHADLRDVALWFRKKTGVPKLEDSGLADVFIGGEGITVDVHVRSANKNDSSSVFKVNSVTVKVDDLKFAIRDSKHDTLYNTLRPLATGLVKRHIQNVFAVGVRTVLEYVDGQLVTVRDRMAAAKADK